jgi:hypothetical protein
VRVAHADGGKLLDFGQMPAHYEADGKWMQLSNTRLKGANIMKGKRFKQGAILTSVLLTGSALLVLQLTDGGAT